MTDNPAFTARPMLTDSLFSHATNMKIEGGAAQPCLVTATNPDTLDPARIEAMAWLLAMPPLEAVEAGR